MGGFFPHPGKVVFQNYRPTNYRPYALMTGNHPAKYLTCPLLRLEFEE